jgi:DNA-binding transcriptional LysR family regulator
MQPGDCTCRNLPSVRTFSALEQAYGVDLFVRQGRSMELSEAGQTILPLVRDSPVRSARLLDDAFQEINNHIGGELLIGCSTSAGKYLLPTPAVRLSTANIRPYTTRVKVMGRDGVYERLVGSKYSDRRIKQIL